MKRRLLAIAATILVGAGIPIATTALPAQAINCQFGDQFWQFHSDLSHNFSATVSASNGQYLVDVAGGGSLYCQTAGINTPTGTYYEWVQKNTANCLTYDVANGSAIKLQPCASLTSQYWQLNDPLGGYEDWGEVINEYHYQGLTEELYDNGSASTFDRVWCGTGTQPPWPPGCLSFGTAFDWSLFGPYR